MNPFDKMNAFNKANPESKDVYRKMQQWQVLNKPENGVFCPSSQLYPMSIKLMQAVASGLINKRSYADFTEQDMQTLQLFWGLHLFGAWRNTLGIYRIDKDILSDIVKSTIPNDTPSSIFSRLPEWCVYVELPHDYDVNITTDAHNSRLLGFWALFDYQNVSSKPRLALNLVPNLKQMVNATFDQYQPIQLFIDDNLTVEQSINDWYKQVYNSNMDGITANIASSLDLQFAKTLLSLLLFLCAEEPDISNILGEPINKDALRLPKYRVNKKTGVFIPPDKPTIYDIGKRLGGEIRTFNERIGSGDSRISSRKRPHIRRGHWHGVWSGTGQNKQFKIYWQPAIFVNAN